MKKIQKLWIINQNLREQISVIWEAFDFFCKYNESIGVHLPLSIKCLHLQIEAIKIEVLRFNFFKYRSYLTIRLLILGMFAEVQKLKIKIRALQVKIDGKLHLIRFQLIPFDKRNIFDRFY